MKVEVEVTKVGSATIRLDGVDISDHVAQNGVQVSFLGHNKPVVSLELMPDELRMSLEQADALHKWGWSK